MRFRGLIFLGVLLVVAGLVLGFVPHSVTSTAGDTIACGSALTGRSQVQEARLQLANSTEQLVPTLQGLEKTGKKDLIAECDSARMAWLPWVLFAAGAAALIAAFATRQKSSRPHSAAW